MTTATLQLSPALKNAMLDNSIGTPSTRYMRKNVYVGLGIDFDESTFTFTAEPVSQWFTIHEEPIEFFRPTDGVIRNLDSITWPKATVDWTVDDETIKYVGLYYMINEDEVDESGSLYDPEYELIGVISMFPEETVLTGEMMVLNANSIQITLANI